LQLRFDFADFRHELVTCGIETIGYFFLEAGQPSAAKALFRVLQEALGNARVMTIPRRVEGYISQQRSTQRNDQVAKTLIFRPKMVIFGLR
jgi:hypothetical protein